MKFKYIFEPVPKIKLVIFITLALHDLIMQRLIFVLKTIVYYRATLEKYFYVNLKKCKSIQLIKLFSALFFEKLRASMQNLKKCYDGVRVTGSD